MAVSDILAEKGNSVVTAEKDATIHEVAKTLASKRIGAVVIVDSDGAACGIVSERDIVREVSTGGSAALSSSVSSCMTHKVIFCEPDDTVDALMAKMTAGKFRHLPVLDNGQLAGIISIGDVVKKKIEQAERDAEDLKRYIAG